RLCCSSLPYTTLFRSGEVMGVGSTFAEAFGKACLGAGERLPEPGGTVFISVRDVDKPLAVEVAEELHELGFSLVATRGTAEALEAGGVTVQRVNKELEGRPHIVDKIKNGDIAMIINTTEVKQAVSDSFTIRRSALQGNE